jgi:hypothetical protein
MKSKFLIILLNYNNWEDTLDCISSLKNCNIDDSNILVIENCSSDESLEKLITNVPGVKIIRSEKNLGFTGGNNLGIKYACENKFDYAIVLNNDTIVEDKNAIEMLINEMDKNPDVTLGTGRIYYYQQKDMIWYDGGKLIKWRGMAIHYNYSKSVNVVKLKDDLKEIDFISGCFMCIRLSDITKLGYMDENFFIYLDDIEYSARAVRKNLKLSYFPEVVIYHKARGEGIQTNRMVYYSIRNRRLLIKLHFGIIAKIYFEVVLVIKRVVWFLTGNKFYSILINAVKDYNKNYFGLAPENIK